MMKTLSRSYATGKEGDLVVTAYDKNGQQTDLSKHYLDIPRDRRSLHPDAYLDVFRYEDGDVTWSGSPNGNHADSAFSYRLLLEALVGDLRAADGSPRAF